MSVYTTKTFGKWILAGEHSVLRGMPALAFPLKTRFIELEYEPIDQTLDVEFSGEHGAELKLLFYGVVENALRHLGRTSTPTGRFRIRNTLPIGTGLGASAALCGAVARWCESRGWLNSDQVYEFARKLEDLFHGESSGVDVAVSLSGHGVHFVRGGERRVVQINWWPKLYLSYSGQRGITSECVQKVKKLFETDPSLAESLDRQMKSAVLMAETALGMDEKTGFEPLCEGIQMAYSCFQKWDLCHGDLEHHLRHLLEAGASAVKPTGSGGGGYALSLWRETPPASLQPHLMEVTPPSLRSDQ